MTMDDIHETDRVTDFELISLMRFSDLKLPLVYCGANRPAYSQSATTMEPIGGFTAELLRRRKREPLSENQRVTASKTQGSRNYGYSLRNRPRPLARYCPESAPDTRDTRLHQKRTANLILYGTSRNKGKIIWATALGYRRM